MDAFEDGVPVSTVEQMTAEQGAGLGPNEILLLPAHVRGGQAFYVRHDLEFKQDAVNHGLRARFVVPGPDRRYLNEFSVHDFVDFAFGVSQNLGADGIIGLGALIVARLRRRRQNGLESDPDREVKVRVVKVGPDGSSETVEVVAPSESVAEQVIQALSANDANSDEEDRQGGA